MVKERKEDDNDQASGDIQLDVNDLDISNISIEMSQNIEMKSEINSYQSEIQFENIDQASNAYEVMNLSSKILKSNNKRSITKTDIK